MKVLILQSYKDDAPSWINRCMESVRHWCLQQGYSRQVINDQEFFAPWGRLALEAPPDTEFPIVVKTDYCRLYWVYLTQHLNHYDYILWVDADIFIWGDFQFSPPTLLNMTVCDEHWYHGNFLGRPIVFPRVNNSFMVFPGQMSKYRTALDWYMATCVHRLSFTPVNNWMLGPNVLTPLVQQGIIAPVIQQGIGCFSPPVYDLLQKNPRKAADLMTDAHGSPLYGANLCHSNGLRTNAKMEEIMDLIETHKYRFTLKRKTRPYSPKPRFWTRFYNFLRARYWNVVGFTRRVTS